jgi:hypothetical protein
MLTQQFLELCCVTFVTVAHSNSHQFLGIGCEKIQGGIYIYHIYVTSQRRASTVCDETGLPKAAMRRGPFWGVGHCLSRSRQSLKNKNSANSCR